MNNAMKCYKTQPAAVLQFRNKCKLLNYCEWVNETHIHGVRMMRERGSTVETV